MSGTVLSTKDAEVNELNDIDDVLAIAETGSKQVHGTLGLKCVFPTKLFC